MDKKQAHRLAERIVGELFTNGYGEKAGRLVLMTGARDLGGWGEGPATDLVERILLLESGETVRTK